MTDPKKDETSKEKTATAPLPQKNAEARPPGGSTKHEEHLLDDALEATFPASDPVAEHPITEHPVAIKLDEEEILEEEMIQHEESLLDEALKLTFPASDPIAVPVSGTAARAVVEQHIPGR